jgi:hypothetical protein
MMVRMDRDELFRRLHRRPRPEVIAAQLPATLAGRTAWLGVYALDLANPESLTFARREGALVGAADDTRVYHVRAFEIADRLRDTWFGESDTENKRSWIVVGDEELLVALAEIGVSTDALDVAWRTGYPL